METQTSRNEVVLVGRLAAPTVQRELPDGETLAAFRLVVDRPPMARRGVRQVTVDTLDCTTSVALLMRLASVWQAGDIVQVEGVLVRRFSRGATGPASRYEVDVFTAKRLANGDAAPA